MESHHWIICLCRQCRQCQIYQICRKYQSLHRSLQSAWIYLGVQMGQMDQMDQMDHQSSRQNLQV